MTPKELLEKYRMAYKKASIADAAIGGMIANSINSGTGERPQYADAKLVADVKDPVKRERLLQAMADEARVNDSHMGRLGGTVTGGIVGGSFGNILGLVAQNVMRGEADKGKPATLGPALGTVGGALLGGYLGDRLVKNDQENRRNRYAAALRAKVRVLRGE